MDWSIRALLMVVGTGLVMSALRVRAASVLHRAWTAAMVAMLLLPVWTNWGPSVTAPILPAAPEHARMQAAAPPDIPRTPEVMPVAVGESVRPVRWPPSLDWKQVLVPIYLVGFAVMLARLIAGTLRVRSMLRLTRKADGIATSSLCAAPVTVGWLRPALLLPESFDTWPAAKLGAVLIHEREHIRRRDPLVQWLALLNRCVFWFHPLAWWLERKLAALAEEACDAAVLAGGYTAHDYARYLIEMAHSVHEKGTLIRSADAVAFSAGNLPGRIRRILDSAPAAALPSHKSVASAALCGLILATFLACSLGPSKPAAKRKVPMLAEERKRAMLISAEQHPRDQALWKAALALTPTGAKSLEADVKADPDDRDKLFELTRYYRSKADWNSLDALTLWYIGQHPDNRLGWGYPPEWNKVWDQDGYERAKQLWTEQLKQTWTNPYVYMNAAEYLSGNDNEQAEQILLKGRLRFPSSALHWEVFLAAITPGH